MKKIIIVIGCIILLALGTGILFFNCNSNTEWFVYNGIACPRIYLENQSELINNTTLKIMESVENGDSTIDFSELGANENTVKIAFMNARFINPLCSVASIMPAEDMRYKLEYGCSDEKWDEKVESIRNKVTQVILQNVEKDDSDIEKAKAIYKYLSSNMEYDTEMLEAQNAEILFSYSLYDAIMEEKGVCFHFAQVYQYYLMQMGIDSIILTDFGVSDGKTDIFGRPVAEGIGHAWNLVNLGDEWYHCDITYENGYYQVQKDSGNEGQDLEYVYWGMGDEKRAESRNSTMRNVYGITNPMKILEIPECPNNLK